MDRDLLLTLAKEYGTPLYVYDINEVRRRLQYLRDVFSDIPLDIHYAVKANTHPAIIDAVYQAGGKFDTVSWNEVEYLKKLGVDERDILFTPSCPSETELRQALESRVEFHTGEWEDLEWIARHYPGRPVGIRINPDLQAGGNRKISTAHQASKFGIPWSYKDRILDIVRSSGLPVKGLHIHLGSDVDHGKAMEQAMDLLFAEQAHFPDLEYVDIGGGFKIPYKKDDTQTDLPALAGRLKEHLARTERPLRVKIEPGKFLVGPAGVFLVEVNRVKQTPYKKFVCVNSGFNHFIRPMYYGAYHEIENLSRPEAPPETYDVVGYLCEEDTFAYDRRLPEVQKGDILAVHTAGAYGNVMASRYNLRPLPKEVVVDGNKIYES